VSDDRWPIDRTSEWFPVLAGRVSVATVQGQEWVEGGAFRSSIDDYDLLQECSERDGSCLADWSDATGVDFDYVYIPKIAPRFAPSSVEECCDTLRRMLEQDGGYRKAYDGGGAVIFARE
jgi:hypothetical protein